METGGIAFPVGMGWLFAIYVATAVFGVGTTVADLLGVFSHLTGGHGHDGGHDAADHDAVGHDAAAHGGAGHHAVGHDPTDATRVSAVAPDAEMRGGGLVRLLSSLRSGVYFCLGFGPVGLFAATQYHNPAVTLLWSIPVGVAVMLGTRALRRLASREISSDIGKDDLLMERGVVTVSIHEGQMGKVRVSVGGRYVDWYARCKTDAELAVGARIRVVDATEECVFVEPD